MWIISRSTMIIMDIRRETDVWLQLQTVSVRLQEHMEAFVPDMAGMSL